jgi:uncharacterized protein
VGGASMKILKFLAPLILFVALVHPLLRGQEKAFRVLAFYSSNVEPDHVAFAAQAVEFFNGLAARDHFHFESTTQWNDLNPVKLKQYDVILWLNDSPHTSEQRAAFEGYMNHGGGWLGFHAAGYNDSDTHWPWFVNFLGGAVFYGNSWPPLPAELHVDERGHPATKGLEEKFTSPANEWYIWQPSPRLNKDVKVLVTLDPGNYPLGLKDTLTGGDIPVVWTNTKYKMIYVNMGHGDKIFKSSEQNRLFEDTLLWLGNRR